MSDNREKNIRKTHALAACSLTAALGTALLFSAGLLPVMTYAAPLVVAVLLIPIKREYRAKWAWPVWFVTAALSLLLCPDKEAALFYLFLGYYPILKEGFDKIKPGVLRVLVKLLFFVVSIPPAIGMVLSAMPTLKYALSDAEHTRMLDELNAKRNAGEIE